MRGRCGLVAWRRVAALVAVSLVVRLCGGADVDGGPALAFLPIWGAIVTAASWVWRIGSRAVTVAIKAMITALQWAVTNLTRLIVAGLKKTAVFLARTAKATWRLIQRGLKATLRALDRAFTWLKSTLDHIFRPVLDFLDRVRIYVRDFYRKWVRPVLDAIEITRRVFQLLGWFGLDWAKAIDRKLQQLEDIITFPFDWLVTKVNELTSWVNRIVTLDGLLQRVMLLRSLIRDAVPTNNLWWNAQTKIYGASGRAALAPAKPGRTFGQAVDVHQAAVNSFARIVDPEIEELAETAVGQWMRAW